ncbi:MAG: hypothetical protein R3B95_19445 [Nitrospirales bacterium]|nr:hypothetical protein [Nitrospirales bacterium]
MSTISNTPRVSTTILSNVSPFSFPFDTTEAKHSLSENRWHALWGSFAMMYIRTASPSTEANLPYTDTLDGILQEECGKTPVLYNFATMFKKYFQSQSEIVNWHHSQEAVRASILQMAQPYYEEIWQSLTVEEQLALFHLSRDRFIHVGHPGLEPLLRKGLVQLNPDLRIINASFQKFVQIAGIRDELNQQEAKRANSIWNALKVPVGIGLTTIIVVLILTQEELRTALPAVIALLPLLLQGIPDLAKEKNKIS